MPEPATAAEERLLDAIFNDARHELTHERDCFACQGRRARRVVAPSRLGSRDGGTAVIVHRGVTRTVVLIGRWAVKLPSLRAHDGGIAGVLWSVTRGIQANLSEREWSGSPGTCPARWSLAGLINVYPRCQPVTHEPTDAEYDAIGLLGPADRKPHNLGWLHGRLVWVDYDMSWNDCLACRRFGFDEGKGAST